MKRIRKRLSNKFQYNLVCINIKSRNINMFANSILNFNFIILRIKQSIILPKILKFLGTEYESVSSYAAIYQHSWVEGSRFDRIDRSRIRDLPWVARCNRAWQRRYRNCTWYRGPGSNHPTVGYRNDNVQAARRCPPNNSCTRLTKIVCDLRPSPGTKHQRTGRAIVILQHHMQHVAVRSRIRSTTKNKSPDDDKRRL